MLILIDVEEPYRTAFTRWGRRQGHEALALPADDLPLLPSQVPALCVLQVGSDREVERSRIRTLQKAVRSCPLVVLARGVSTDAVVALIREGAADVIGLPAEPEDAVSRAALCALDDAGAPGAHELVGRTPVIARLRQDLASVAPMQSTVLITGETGSGKGVAARVLHDMSNRRRRAFVHVDCASLASSVVESELFGHERGSFTGAVGRRAGRFEAAGRGTIFLDEIGELDPDLQAKLLRVLQDRTFERIGGSQTLRMEARVIAATNRDLRGEVRAGRFRADLFFRLAVFEVNIPPLRARLDDIPLLVRRALDQLAPRLSVPAPPVADSFYEALCRYAWPGNVRELFNVLERLLVRAGGRPLDAACLEGLVPPSRRIPEPAAAEDGDLEGVLRALAPDLEDEGRRIAEVLVSTGGNVARAARRLEMPRSTLRYRIQRHGLGALIPDD